jgi:hypothetical protein
MTCIDRPSRTLNAPKLLEMASTLMIGEGMRFSAGDADGPNDAERFKSCQLVK